MQIQITTDQNIEAQEAMAETTAVVAHQPIAVTHHADTIALAVDGASGSLVSLIENTLGRTEALRRAQRS